MAKLAYLKIAKLQICYRSCYWVIYGIHNSTPLIRSGTGLLA